MDIEELIKVTAAKITETNRHSFEECGALELKKASIWLLIGQLYLALHELEGIEHKR